MRRTTDRHKRRTGLKPLHGLIVLVLGVIVLSYVELELLERAHPSTGALYVALASDLKPVLREWSATSPR